MGVYYRAALRWNEGRSDGEDHWANVAIVYILGSCRVTLSLEKGLEMHVSSPLLSVLVGGRDREDLAWFWQLLPSGILPCLARCAKDASLRHDAWMHLVNRMLTTTGPVTASAAGSSTSRPPVSPARSSYLSYPLRPYLRCAPRRSSPSPTRLPEERNVRRRICRLPAYRHRREGCC